MTARLVTSTAIAALLCTTALLPPAKAQSVPLGEATLQGDELIDTPVGSIELNDSYLRR